MIVWLSFALLSGLLCSFVAQKKGRSALGGFLWGFFLPVLALLVFLLLPPKNSQEPNADLNLDLQELEALEETEELREEKQEESSFLLWYYLDEQKQVCGPLSMHRLKEDCKEGRVIPSTLVWNDTLEKWTPYKEVVKDSFENPTNSP